MHLEPFDKDQVVVLQAHKEEDAEGFVYKPDKHKPRNFMWKSFFDLFPHLFEPLPWWKERKPEDMPHYVKHIATGKMWKVKEYDLPTGAHLIGVEISSYWAVMKNLEPATLDDYNAYLQTTNQNNG
jgi:hypothetical protein